MISIIKTLIICATVLYCIRMIIACIDSKIVISSDVSEPITDEVVDKAYDELRKENKLPADITEFMKAMQLDFDE